MKTTIELPDRLFRQAKARAAERGQTLKALVTEALQDKLNSGPRTTNADEPPWMQGFGALRGLRRETSRIETRIEEAFEVLDAEDRA